MRPDAWLARLGGTGIPNWSWRYGGSGDDRGHTAGMAGDGFFVAGETRSFGAGGIDAYAVKTDGGGSSGCEESRFTLKSVTAQPVQTFVSISPVLLPSTPWEPRAERLEMPGQMLCSSCPADLNGDGIVDFSDYLEFLNLYDAGDVSVDYTGDGIVDFTDYLEFLNYYDRCS